MFESFNEEEMNFRRPDTRTSDPEISEAREVGGEIVGGLGSGILFVAGVGASMVILSSILAFTGWGLFATLAFMLCVGFMLALGGQFLKTGNFPIA